MQARYSLNEVWIPEDEDLEEEYRHLPRNNIYMSDDFRSEKVVDKNALILIQGTGAVRAG
jgi:hypothetical protein